MATETLWYVSEICWYLAGVCWVMSAYYQHKTGNTYLALVVVAIAVLNVAVGNLFWIVMSK